MNDLCKEVIKAAQLGTQEWSGGRNVVFLKVYSARFEGSLGHIFLEAITGKCVWGKDFGKALCCARAYKSRVSLADWGSMLVTFYHFRQARETLCLPKSLLVLQQIEWKLSPLSIVRSERSSLILLYSCIEGFDLCAFNGHEKKAQRRMYIYYTSCFICHIFFYSIV